MDDAWLEIHRGTAPLIVSFPHTGTSIPAEVAADLVSEDLALKDTDWWVDQLYGFARDLGATTIRSGVSRSVIDLNRDPSGQSLYPGQATTQLCPLTSFDGEDLYFKGHEPDEAEIARRRGLYFDPYHEALTAELARLKETYGTVVLYDAHSIRSQIPRLFDGVLPVFNIGSNHDETCAAGLADRVESICSASGEPTVRNGRFRGGWTIRHHGAPEKGVHAIQMELACRGYLDEPLGPVTHETWPVPYRPERAASLASVLRDVLGACLEFAKTPDGETR